MKERILQIFKGTDWTLIKDQNNIKMMQFQDGGMKVNIYWGTMTITLIGNGLQTTYHNQTLKEIRKLLRLEKKNILHKMLAIFKHDK